MFITVREVLAVLEAAAPLALAESWDNVGLLLGDPAQPVTGVVTALDATATVLEQAETHGANLLVTHHPLIFGGLKRLVEDGGTSTLLRRMIRGGVALIAMHTNLDSAPGGLNDAVAALLGVRETRPLVPSEARPLLKLVVYVPPTHVDAVRTAICEAGAGQIGRYRTCTFGAPGVGTFQDDEGATPFIGTVGALTRVEEIRLETVVPRAKTGAVLAAMLRAHPYEEVAYDLLPLDNAWPGAGLGRIGTLEAPVSLAEFVIRTGQALSTARLGVIGDTRRMIRTVALCTGGGGEYLDAALSAGADLYLTGEVKHHQALLARERGIAVIEAGHFATEHPAVPLLADLLRRGCPGVPLHLADEADPFNTLP